MKKGKRNIIALTLAFIIVTTFVSSRLENLEDNIVIDYTISDPLYRGTCRSGDVYIGTESQIKNLINNGVEGVFVVDQRNDDEPNVKIINSYKITNKKKMREVLMLIKRYDEENPSKWSRTINSMVNEWWAHNICYDSNYYACHSKDVDLNNGDEEVFDGLNIYRLILRKKELESAIDDK